MKKSKIFRTGKNKTNAKKFETQPEFIWSHEDIEMLGVTITNGPTQSGQGLYDTIDSMSKIAEQWQYRNLTLMGKIMIINTLMAPLFVHKMYIIPMITDEQILKINKILECFIWNGAKPKIPLKFLQLPKKLGGLGLTDFRLKHSALILQWIKNIDDNEFLKGYVYQWLIPSMRHFVWECNLNRKDIVEICPPTYWRHVLETWSDINFREPIVAEEICEQILWYNSHIRVGGKVLKPINSMLHNGLLRVKHLIENHQIKAYETLTTQYGHCSWLQYRQIISAIPKGWRTLIMCEQGDGSTEVDSDDTDVVSTQVPRDLTYSSLLDAKKLVKYIYQHLSTQKAKKQPYLERYRSKWNNVTDSSLSGSNYLRLFQNLYKITNVTKYRDFQYRLLIGKIYPNTTLVKWKVVDSAICNFCENEAQDIKHMLYTCPIVTKLWDYIGNAYGINLTFKQIMCNDVTKEHCSALNFTILFTKQYIYRCKCENSLPKTVKLKADLLYWRNIELFNAQKNLTVHKHEKKWSGWALD